jgi:hypothetical protein
MLNTEEGREGERCACVGCEASKNKNELRGKKWIKKKRKG